MMFAIFFVMAFVMLMVACFSERSWWFWMTLWGLLLTASCAIM